jgi:hypothetical protein
MAKCLVCGRASATCTSSHYQPTLVPDLLNEGGPFVAKTENVIRMPQQHVRSGRGTPGYKSTDEAKVEVYDTERPITLRGGSAASTTRRTSARRSTKRAKATPATPVVGETTEDGQS